jgi:hypothetical protein
VHGPNGHGACYERKTQREDGLAGRMGQMAIGSVGAWFGNKSREEMGRNKRNRIGLQAEGKKGFEILATKWNLNQKNFEIKPKYIFKVYTIV